jgi:hypothetical protein
VIKILGNYIPVGTNFLACGMQEFIFKSLLPLSEFWDFCSTYEALKIEIPIFGALLVAWFVFEWNKAKEHTRIISELKNETVRICNRVRISKAMINLNYCMSEYYYALYYFYDKEDDLKRANKYLNNSLAMVERTNDYVDLYNSLESDLLKCVSTLHKLIPEGDRVKKYWKQFDLMDDTHVKYYYLTMEARELPRKHKADKDRLTLQLNNKKTILPLYNIQRLLNPTFFPAKYKRPKTLLQKLKHWILFHARLLRRTGWRTKNLKDEI